MQAMILAAGFGTRLLPYTLCRPKPLFPVLNRPLLLLIVERLRCAGCDRIVVNCHYLKEQIVHALQGIPGVVVQEEAMVLGTGGGLRLALEGFRDEPVLVTNGDIYHTIDYRELYQYHLDGGMPVTMAMHDYPRFNKVMVLENEVCSFDEQGPGQLLAFTGMHVVNPEVLAMIPLDQEYSIIDCYRQLLAQKQPIAALRVDDCFWADMGTVADYLELHGGLLNGTIPCWPEIALGADAPFIIAESAAKGQGLVLQEWACVGDAKLGAQVSLRRTVVWDGAVVEDGASLVDQVVVPAMVP